MSFYSCTVGVKVYCRGMEENNNNREDKMNNRPTFEEAAAHIIAPLINLPKGAVSTSYKNSLGARMLTITNEYGVTIGYTWHGRNEGFSFAGEIK